MGGKWTYWIACEGPDSAQSGHPVCHLIDRMPVRLSEPRERLKTWPPSEAGKGVFSCPRGPIRAGAPRRSLACQRGPAFSDEPPKTRVDLGASFSDDLNHPHSPLFGCAQGVIAAGETVSSLSIAGMAVMLGAAGACLYSDELEALFARIADNGTGVVQKVVRPALDELR
jgi:hypothetical protein